ncbi:MAG: DUF6438 domain-containing protein [Flavobacteriales bacterium]
MKKNIALLLWSAALLTSLSACFRHAKKTEVPAAPPVAEVSTTPSNPVVVLFYERTPCFGMCPSFNLTVYSNGKATYEGKNFVDHIGFYQSQWDATALQNIMTAAEKISYFSLADRYDQQGVTDLPTVRTRLLKDGNLKEVANRYKGPKELQSLYQVIDDQIKLSEWKPIVFENKQ